MNSFQLINNDCNEYLEISEWYFANSVFWLFEYLCNSIASVDEKTHQNKFNWCFHGIIILTRYITFSSHSISVFTWISGYPCSQLNLVGVTLIPFAIKRHIIKTQMLYEANLIALVIYLVFSRSISPIAMDRLDLENLLELK